MQCNVFIHCLWMSNKHYYRQLHSFTYSYHNPVTHWKSRYHLLLISCINILDKYLMGRQDIRATENFFTTGNYFSHNKYNPKAMMFSRLEDLNTMDFKHPMENIYSISATQTWPISKIRVWSSGRVIIH